LDAYFFLSQQRPSAEGAAKIFKKFIPQMEKQKLNHA
jgi:hypothetical protein